MSTKSAPEDYEAALRLRLANKRKATEWFDIWAEVVEHGVKVWCKQNPHQQALAMENLRSRRPQYQRVRDDFEALGLEFQEAFKTEGVNVDEDGNWTMPGGFFTIRMVTRKEHVTFMGDKAAIAFGFFSWWRAFKDTINPAAIPGSIPLIGK